MEQMHGTTILSVRRGVNVALGGDGQVTLGNVVIKGGAKKIRRLYQDRILAGFAGGTADAFTLFERFEGKLDKHQGNLMRAAVELVKQKDRYVPQFAKDVAVLDQKLVKVQGFMMPLQMGDKQTHFVLSAMPQSCAFCMPGGPESMVEVKSKAAVKYTFEPVILTGRLSVLKDDPTGVFYRLTDAVQSK